MSATTIASKVTAEHLARTAYLYVRQSTLRQVKDNTESAQRQYALRQRAIQLGWPVEQIVVIDTDQGQSGASAADREGFQRLVADVGLGKAGIVLGLEVSRLARNNADWHRLLEICALAGTLICDEDGLYDPADFNDRLLLGLKGTMSEAELHFIRARLQGGILSKARRGELPMPLPVGLVYDSAGKVVLDPDRAVQDALRHLFATFARTGSARAVVYAFNRDGLLFPSRIRKGARNGELAWNELSHWRVLRTLHNPRYAGAFAYGRRRTRKAPNGTTSSRELPREQWTALIHDAHPGYLTWEQFEHNQRQLAANAQALGTDRAAGPAREGPALLQGLAICGRCGRRLSIRYHQRRDTLVPDYQCVDENIQRHAATLPHDPRSHHRPRDQPTAARHRHAARARGRAHRPSRTRSPRQRGRPAPPLTRRTRPPARRPRPPPLPRSRPRQPARRRHPRSRLERRAARAASRPRRIRPPDRRRQRRARREAQDPDPRARHRLPEAVVRPRDTRP